MTVDHESPLTSSTQIIRALVAEMICPLAFLVTPPSIEEKLREKPNQGLESFSYMIVRVAIFSDSRYCESSNIPSLVVASPSLQPVHSLNHLLPGRFLDRSRVESPHLQQAGLQMIFVVCLFCYLLHPYFQKAWLEISFASCYLHKKISFILEIIKKKSI